MKFSYQWIQECVPGLDTPASSLEQLITVRTAECDGIHPAGELLSAARVATVLAAEPVAGTHITKALVDVGDGAPVTVACGASNCRAGLRTLWVPLGRKVIQGIESYGMLASPIELGLGRDAAGIIEWNESALALLPDSIIEIDNKSLTHRPDLWGHLGMAREVAAITRKELADPVDLALLPAGSEVYDVRIDDFELCPRFSAAAFENVKVAPSPYWLQYRLLSVGLNPINNIVDITNFVMAELAQPMHAFDRAKLRGDRLIVRPAHEAEKLLALDDTEYTLTPADGVVADQAGAVSIAGIIGGRPSAISDTTTDIVFESANWKASQIRKTSSRLKLRTDASMRFEKAQDPANTVRAIARAIALMKLVCPEARLAGRFTDAYLTLPQPVSIRLSIDVVNRKLGRDVPEAEVRSILGRLEFGVHSAGPGTLDVTVPSWRATKDVAVADDLVEEVGRMIGYDTITPVPPAVACTVPPDNLDRVWHRELRALLTARGFTEVYNYSFLSDEQAARFQLASADQVRVRNPIASDQNLLRSSLIPGIAANLELNAKHYAAFRLFEIGREIHNRQPAKPLEITHLAAAVYSADGDGTAAVLELKRAAESIAPGCRVEPDTETMSYEHPARTGKVMSGGSEIGRLFELHPGMLQGRAAVLDLNLDRILEVRTTAPPYQPLRRFPSSAFDLTLLAKPRDLAAVIRAHLAAFAGPLLESVSYKYEFPLPAGRSMTFHFVLRAPERTLASEEINSVRENVIEKMRGLGYDMRV